MKKVILALLIFCSGLSYSFGQITQHQGDSLKQLLNATTNDSIKLGYIIDLVYGYRGSEIDSAFHYINYAIEIAQKNNIPSVIAHMISMKGYMVLETGRLPESLQLQFQALDMANDLDDKYIKGLTLNRIGNTYMELADYPKAIYYYNQSKDNFSAIQNDGWYYNEISNIGNIYALMEMPDSALYYQQLVLKFSDANPRLVLTVPEIMFRMGNGYKLKKEFSEAANYYRKGIYEARKINDVHNLAMCYVLLAQLYYETGSIDSSMFYAKQAMESGKSITFRKVVYESSTLLSQIYQEQNNYTEAYHYLTEANTEKDSLYGIKRFQELQNIVLNDQEKKRETEAKIIADKNKLRQNLLIGGLSVFLLIVVILIRNNQHKQKANKVLEATLQNLKTTQSQLIQSEKMASLGELTAGIAHEIQNPLNFVNNFSEVNTELIDELHTELNKGNAEEAAKIAKDIKENEEKIMHHGKRADAIVKSMLQHSRSSSGVKELTDINALCDEYFRLAYHGLRAKNKSFNCTMESDFDPAVGKINIMTQDVGRVILNLITNAFYAVSDKKKTQTDNYEPAVKVSTRRIKDKIEIRVNDNGNGIPQTVIDKIFQPFFTTKPTGEGTGLGLSLSYDIIKTHKGELKVETQEGKGATFIIILPL